MIDTTALTQAQRIALNGFCLSALGMPLRPLEESGATVQEPFQRLMRSAITFSDSLKADANPEL
jgi:hypothetical protein